MGDSGHHVWIFLWKVQRTRHVDECELGLRLQIVSPFPLFHSNVLCMAHLVDSPPFPLFDQRVSPPSIKKQKKKKDKKKKLG